MPPQLQYGAAHSAPTMPAFVRQRTSAARAPV